MKKTIIALAFSLTLILSACNVSSSSPISCTLEHSPVPDVEVSPAPETSPSTESSSGHSFVYEYFTFEELLTEFPPTDVVIVQYVGHRPFGRTLTEFEFIVQERILGNAEDRIFVYVERPDIDIWGNEIEVSDRSDNLTFSHGTDYLLPLRKISSVYANTRENGFTLIRRTVIDLNDPSRSTMHGKELSQHSTGLDFSARSVARQEVVSYVEDLTRDNAPAREFIRSEAMEDIISGSPHVALVEIKEPLRLNDEVPPSDWMSTDIYHATIIQSLKSGFLPGDEIVVIFFADTVFPGEQHIVAIEAIREGSYWFDLSSRNSLFGINEQHEIEEILGIR
ncbi:MAG: hypothetical protein FWE06_03975 [Oscillospiraceae bacterium]|nr:hypothetical protein [Oscillospiraceae bacterium]